MCFLYLPLTSSCNTIKVCTEIGRKEEEEVADSLQITSSATLESGCEAKRCFMVMFLQGRWIELCITYILHMPYMSIIVILTCEDIFQITIIKQIHARTLQAAVKLLDGINPKEALSKPSGHLERMTFQKPTKETDVSEGGGRAKGGGRRKRGDGETPAPPKNKETLVKFVSYFACVSPTSLYKIKSST